MQTKHKILMGVIIVSVVLTILGITYAFFSAELAGNEDDTTITLIGGKLKIDQYA